MVNAPAKLASAIASDNKEHFWQDRPGLREAITKALMLTCFTFPKQTQHHATVIILNKQSEMFCKHATKQIHHSLTANQIYY